MTLGFVCVVASLAVGAVEKMCFPFPVSHDSPDNVVNMRGLLDAPAGKYGFLRSEGEHFVHSNGTVRLNGINLTGPAVFPSHVEADALADRFARFGFNCVRLHFFDCAYSNAIGIVRRGIFVENEFPRRKLDPERVDRLHYLVAALKQRGIYTDVNLRVGRTLDTRDGVVPSGFANRGANFLDPKLRAFEKEYARDLLTRKNAYTGLSLAEDPAVALVEIYNENGLLSYHYYENKLEKLPEPYRSQLAESRRRYRERTGKDDFVGHLTELDRAYWIDMRDYLKNELAVKCPVVGTVLEYSPPHTQAELDAVDIHLYWEHPEKGVAWWRSVLDAQFPGCCILGGGDARVKGKPFLVTESNNPYPSPFGSEYQPILHAYGAFQDWTGVFAYTWNCTTNAEPQSMEFYFSYAPRVDCVAHFPAVAALFLRGDVTRYRRRIDLNLPKDVFAENLRKLGGPAKLQGVASASGRTLDETLVLVHGVGVDVTAKTPAVADAAWEKTAGRTRYESDTGELTWFAGDLGTRRFTADTAGTKFLSGYTKDQRVTFADGVALKVGETGRGWAAVSLVSKDDTGFGADGRAARLLLTATAGGANTGLKTEPVPGKEGRRLLGLKGEWGTAPYLVEGVPLALALKVEPLRVRCWALDPTGARKCDVAVAAASDGTSIVRVDPSFQTLWYEIEIVESAAEVKRRQVVAQTEARIWKGTAGELPYRFHAPTVSKSGQRYPLVVLMHGAGSRGTDNVRQVNNGGRDLFDWSRRMGRDFFFLAPQCPAGRQWVDGPWGALTHTMSERPNSQMATALELIEETVRREAVDPARVYVMGISMGGYATWELLQRRPDLFAGALPCCGGGDVALAGRLKDVPVWAFHGDDDGVVPVSRSRDMVAALRNVGAPVLYREYPGVNHDCWTRTFADDTVFDWLFAQKKGRLEYGVEKNDVH